MYKIDVETSQYCVKYNQSFDLQHKKLHPEIVIESKIKIEVRDAGTDDDVVS
jgi:hypothetical protein